VINASKEVITRVRAEAFMRPADDGGADMQWEWHTIFRAWSTCCLASDTTSEASPFQRRDSRVGETTAKFGPLRRDGNGSTSASSGAMAAAPTGGEPTTTSRTALVRTLRFGTAAQ
jgi:hypothetical protein